jgi:hypothetical protein
VRQLQYRQRFLERQDAQLVDLVQCFAVDIGQVALQALGTSALPEAPNAAQEGIAAVVQGLNAVLYSVIAWPALRG